MTHIVTPRSVSAPKPALTRADADAFAQLIEQRFGHQPEEHRMLDLAALLEARLRRTGAAGWAQYRKLLVDSPTEWEQLAPLLTVPETYFFRLPEHFEALAEDALPKVLAANEAQRSLRLLSAGCATGEEPYTLRIVLNERFPQLANWRVEIVGVDLSAQALERARLGVYNSWSLRGTSEARQRANFAAAGKQFRLNPQARAGVEFRRENLLAPPPAGEAPFDVIFCRNVLIYFSPAAIGEAIARLTKRLAPGGFLFLGPAESLRGLSRDFHLCHTHDTFFYRRKADAERAAAEPSLAAAQPANRTHPLASADPAGDATWFASIRSSSERLAAMTTLESLTPSAASGSARRPPSAQKSPRQNIGTSGGAQGFTDLVKAERFADALALLETEAPVSLSSVTGADVSGDEPPALLRASLLTNLGRYAEAETECRALLARDELNAAAHYLLGLCLEQVGAIDEAAEQLARSTYLDPGFAMAHLHRGLLALRRSQTAAAESSLRLALQAVEKEDPQRLAIFGGGFSREGLRALCLRELGRLGVP